jgi:hypothetical protein
MQSDCKTLYRLASEKNDVPEQLYKDLGNFVFKKLYDKLKRPESLILKLKGVGQWYLRRARMKYIIDNYPVREDIPEEELYKYENTIETQRLFKERLKDYDEYIALRDEIRKIRYETQVLLQPDHGEDQGTETS